MALLGHCLRVLAILTVTSLPQVVPAQAMAADCYYTEQAVMTNGTVQMQLVLVCPPGSATDEVSIAAHGPTDFDLDPICVSTAITNGVDPFEFCELATDATSSEITPALVAAALARIPLPAASLQVQPPNGRTLVNFETNFYTDTRAFERTLILLGQQVNLHIVPSEFGWRFGDGESLLTAEPGAPYPDLEVTHRYLKKGQVAARVDTTYTATYQVNGGPSIDVKGQVTIPGVPVDLQVLTATPTLVGYDRDSFLGGGPA